MIHHVPPLPTCKITKNHGNNLSAHQFLPIFANGYFIHAFAQIAAEEKNVHCFYMDVNATRNLTEFIHYFAKTVIGKVDTLEKIFDYLRLSEKRIYIAIDEFQQVAEYPEKGTEALLRSYIQFLPNVYFIFAGSKQHIMADMFLSAKRPFYQSAQIMNLPLIKEDKY